MRNIIIFWEQMPVCGLLLNELNIDNSNVTIYATRPKVPFEDLDKFLKHQIIWIDTGPHIKIPLIEKKIDLFAHSGWGFSGFVKKFIKANNSVIKKRVLLMDNIDINFSLKRFLGKLIFKYLFKNYYTAVIVPGILSYNYALSLGFPFTKIYIGYYGASNQIFNSEEYNKKNNFLFIGQKIKRKGIRSLLNAYKLYRDDGGLWGLIVAGHGQLQDDLISNNISGLKELQFQQPIDAALLMKSSKCLVMPSYEDHWGTVACEAAACGLPLLLSNQVGASPDILVNGINGYMYDPGDYLKLAELMKEISQWPLNKHIEASKTSIELAGRFNGNEFSRSIKSILDT